MMKKRIESCPKFLLWSSNTKDGYEISNEPCKLLRNFNQDKAGQSFRKTTPRYISQLIRYT
jgi:hypothetical protein